MSMYGCSDTIQVFAIIGMIVVFAAIYFGLAVLVSEVLLAIKGKRYPQLSRDEKDMVILGTIFWPITLVVGLVWLVAKWIILPFIAATKQDLRETEQRINRKIILNSVAPKSTKKFKVGDLIQGVKGNPDNYKHLNEGCKCRVLSIDEKGSMKLVLVDHKNFNAHKDVIGNTFKAPARNFVKARK